MGSDNLHSFHKWKNYTEILKHYELYIYPRANKDGGDLINHKKVKLVNAPIIEISSSAIRAGVKEKKDLRYFMPDEAWEFMKGMHFYEK